MQAFIVASLTQKFFIEICPHGMYNKLCKNKGFFMTRTYTIHLNPYTISILNTPNFAKIPNNASTQYVYRIYPDAHFIMAPDTTPNNRHVFRQRKVIAHPDKPAVVAPMDIAPTQKAPKQKPQHSKYRNNVNKAALSKYFDNTPTPQEEWIADVVAELNRQDALRAAAARKDQVALRQFVESTRNVQPDFKNIPELDTQHVFIVVIDTTPFVRDIAKIIDADACNAEINANILDKFDRQMRHLSQSRSMKKMHDRFKLRHK